jgi:DNA-binding transcriptional ArsR family regulator
MMKTVLRGRPLGIPIPTRDAIMGLQRNFAPVTDEPTRVQMWATAHPVRLRIFELLREGPATASQLARRLGESSGTTSYHLRVLEGAGAIAEDPSLGTRRERYWRRPERLTLIPTDADREGREISARMFGIFVARDEEARQRFLTREVSAEWHEAAFVGSWFVELTPAEASELGVRLLQVVDEYRKREPPTEADTAVVSLNVLPWLE